VMGMLVFNTEDGVKTYIRVEDINFMRWDHNYGPSPEGKGRLYVQLRGEGPDQGMTVFGAEARHMHDALKNATMHGTLEEPTVEWRLFGAMQAAGWTPDFVEVHGKRWVWSGEANAYVKEDT